MFILKTTDDWTIFSCYLLFQKLLLRTVPFGLLRHFIFISCKTPLVKSYNNSSKLHTLLDESKMPIFAQFKIIVSDSRFCFFLLPQSKHGSTTLSVSVQHHPFSGNTICLFHLLLFPFCWCCYRWIFNIWSGGWERISVDRVLDYQGPVQVPSSFPSTMSSPCSADAHKSSPHSGGRCKRRRQCWGSSLVTERV